MSNGLERKRVLSGYYRRFLAFQLAAMFVSLSISEEGNPVVYSIKLLAIALPVMSCGALYVLGQGVTGSIGRSLHSFRHIWLIAALGMVGSLWAADSVYTASKASVFLATFASLTCVLAQYEFLPTGKRADILSRHLLFACSFLLLIMALNFFVFNAGAGGRYRAGGNLIAPTNAAATVGLALMISLHHAVRVPATKAKPWLRAIAIATLILSMWALLVLSTRAAFICTAGGLFLAPILAGGFRLTYRRIVLGSALLTVIVLASVNLDLLASVLARDIDTTSVWTMSGRTWLWARAFNDLTVVRAMLGYGFAAISESVGIQDWWMGDTTLAGAHNAYLQVFLGTGIFGFYFYIRFLWGFFKELRNKAKALPEKQMVISFAIFIYFVTFGITEHLFGLNLTPAFFLICSLYASTKFRTQAKGRASRDAS